MSVHVHPLREAENIDSEPFLVFMQWAREFDNECSFGQHFDWPDSTSSIVDLGSLKKEIEDALASRDPETLKPPDLLAANILIWLTQRLADGVCLAYVSW